MSKKIFVCCILIMCLIGLLGCVSSYRIKNNVENNELNENDFVDIEEEIDFDREIKIPVLMYHDISKEQYFGAHSVNITIDRFKEHILGLLDNGYNPISIIDYCEFIENEKDLPDKPIIITFDDGYISNYELAFPFLKGLEVPAAIFIVTSTVGEEVSGGKVNTPHFTWEQAIEMEDSGIIEIHSHSHTHSKMAKLNEENLDYEMRTSKELIQEKLNKEEVMFAYPYGNYNDETLSKGEEIGYVLQVLVEDNDISGRYAAVNTKNKLSHFSRISVDGNLTIDELLVEIDKAIECSKIFE